jgi:hypothetical protein
MEIPTPIEISGILSEQDYLRLNYFIAWQGKGTRGGIIYFAGLCVFLNLLILFLNISGALPDNFLPMNWPNLLIFLLFPLAFYFLIHIAAKAAYARDPFVKKKRTYVFDDDGMTCMNENSTTRISWNEVDRCLESKYMFVVALSNRQMFPIPKHFLTGLQEEQIRYMLGTTDPASRKGFRKWFRKG